MPESDRTVKCPICDEDFDPTVAGGWCTNPDCGEWQHTDESAADFDTDDGVPDDADLIPEGTDEADPTDGRSMGASGEADAPDGHTVADDSDDEASVDGASDTGAAEAGDETVGTAETADTADTTEHEPEADTDAENGTEPNVAEEPDEADETPDQSSSDSDADAETSNDTSETDDDATTISCPDCDRELDADANFCVACGADVQDITPGDDGSLDACPSCDTAVDDDASFCVNCGEDLDAHRGESDTPTADSTGSSTADETESESAATGNAVDTLASQSTDDAAVPDKLVLSVEGRDITIEDGDRIGREIRAALLDAGRPEDEAVRIHREHVRFDRQPEGYYLVDLGDNPTRLNETQLQKGDREPIQPGDELELSGVATMTIRAA